MKKSCFLRLIFVTCYNHENCKKAFPNPHSKQKKFNKGEESNQKAHLGPPTKCTYSILAPYLQFRGASRAPTKCT